VADAPAERPRGRAAVREGATGYLMLLPALAAFGVFVFYPLVRVVQLGFYRTPPFPNLPSKFVGFSQYGSVLSSSTFLQSLWTTVLFVLFTVPAGIVLGLALAALARRHLAGIGFFRTIFSSTIATSAAVASLVFFTLLDPEVGLIAYWLGERGGNSILESPTFALPAVAMVTVWQGLGFTFILVSAAMQSVPEDLEEAARVDGAGSWRVFSRITLPLLAPTLFFAAVVGTISSFQAFGQIDLLTGGGPDGHTTTLVYQIYQSAFGGGVNDPGQSAVVAVALFAILLVLTFLQFRFFERRVFYGR
jgi:sn-glycerol 3-phosphate transport system permease protein